ncbi:aBC-type multidrug transport system ATPase and permease components [Coprobacillus sp. CAG:698]|nr:aBC-type multidrug transport system ATPase and permease components [Coprobacillus sp. CAG:698]
MNKQERILPTKTLIKYLYYYMKGYYKQYLLAIFFMVINVGCDLALPYLIGVSLKLLGKEVILLESLICVAVLGLMIIAVLCISSYCLTMTLHYTSHKIIYKMREDVFAHIQNLSHAQLSMIPTGTLVTRATSDVNVLFNMYTNVLINLLKNVVTIILVFVTMFLLNFKLTLILLVIVPVILIFSYFFRKYLRRVHRQVRTNVASMNAFLSENITGMKITQVFNQENKKLDEFKANNKQLEKSLLKQTFLFGIFRPSIFVMYIISVAIVLWFGGNQAIEFNLGITTVAVTYDMLFTFYQYVSKFFNPIQALADQFNELQSAFASAEKIFYILSINPEIVDSEDAIDLDITGDIEFKDVWFSYVPDEWVLKGVSFHIHKDDTVAFVGATGSGKTTILSLIVRNYDIQKGQILIDGVDIKKIKLSSLRKQISEMLQDVFMFSGTIYSNIQMNEDNITMEDVKKASEYVNASKFIDKLENGYFEETKERGNNYSLGQRQLVSFARTIVHKPKVLILDEATSNIDTETETLIQDSLEKIMNDGTVIVVAHRLSTIQHANKIYVFNNGQIIEEGTHQELLKKQGRYYHLYLLQFAENN